MVSVVCLICLNMVMAWFWTAEMYPEMYLTMTPKMDHRSMGGCTASAPWYLNLHPRDLAFLREEHCILKKSCTVLAAIILKENPPKICESPFVLKKSPMLFRMSEIESDMPHERISDINTLHF